MLRGMRTVRSRMPTAVIPLVLSVLVVVASAASVAAAAGSTTLAGGSSGGFGGVGGVGDAVERTTTTTIRPTTTVRHTTAPPTTVPPTTVPPTTTAPPTTAATTTSVPSTTVPALEHRVSESDRATTRLNRVVIALLVLAFVIGAVTVFFWVRTRPGRVGGSRTGMTILNADGTSTSVRSAAGSDRAVAGRTSVPTAGSSDPGDPWHVAPAPELPEQSHVDNAEQPL